MITQLVVKTAKNKGDTVLPKRSIAVFTGPTYKGREEKGEDEGK